MTDHRTLRQLIADLPYHKADELEGEEGFWLNRADVLALLAAPAPRWVDMAGNPVDHHVSCPQAWPCKCPPKEAPADAPPAAPRPRCECGHTQTFHDSGMGPCSYSNGYVPTCECQSYREPAAEPPAPPAQALTPEDVQAIDQWNGHDPVDATRIDSLIDSHEALRAEVARLQDRGFALEAHIGLLQEELKRADEGWDNEAIRTSTYAKRADTERKRAAELEAEAQGLRERIAEVRTWAEMASFDAESDVSPVGHKRFYDMRHLLALLSPAQER
jgi:hypothetical protein